jgi:TonB family protein
LLLGFALIRLAPPMNPAAFDDIVEIFIPAPKDDPALDARLVQQQPPTPSTVTPLANVYRRIGVPNAKHDDGKDPAEGAIPKPGGIGGDSIKPGPGNKRTVAPPLLTAPESNWNAPPGKDGGTGTGGTGLGEEGPSYGVAAEGNPHGTSKAAGELNQNGDVWLSVKVNADGGFSAPQITSTSGSDRLDDEAVRLVSRWRFTAGMKQGVAVGGAVRLHVSFAHGQYTIEVEK